MASCRVENRAKKAQNGTVSASQLVKASQKAIFFFTQQISIVLLYCVQSLVGKGCFLATKRAQKRVCIVCLASAAILPFLVTSPDIQFWLSAALVKVFSSNYKTNRFDWMRRHFELLHEVCVFTTYTWYNLSHPITKHTTRHLLKVKERKTSYKRPLALQFNFF